MRQSNIKFLKQLNRSKILQYILHNKGVSRADVSRELGINKATVSSQVAALINDKIIIESISSEKAIGRTPIRLGLNNKAGYAIGVDIDIQKIIVIVTDLSGKVVSKKYDFLNTSDFQQVTKKIKETIDDQISRLAKTAYGIIGVGIGIHNTVTKDNKVGSDTNFAWQEVDVVPLLSTALGAPVFLFNNTNLSVYAEKRDFTACKNMLTLNISSGVGLGIYIEGNLYRGMSGYAGEIGHNIVQKDGLLCQCGNRGCAEQYISDIAIIKSIEKALQRKLDHTNDIPSLYHTHKEVREIISQANEYIYILVANLAKTFNPEVIIINSKFAKLDNNFLQKFTQQFSCINKNLDQLVFSKYGENSTALGGALYVIDHFFNHV